jgi:hypothetical protein
MAVTPPPTNPKDPLAIYWQKQVSDLVEVENSDIATRSYKSGHDCTEVQKRYHSCY